MSFGKNILIVLLLSIVSFAAFGQKSDDYKQYRILILLDGSSSMRENWMGNSTRFQTAAAIVTRLMDSVYKFNPNVEFGLRVYGHQHGVLENNCFDTKREVNFSKDNYTQMLLRLEALKPYGVSPIAYSLKQAAEMDFGDPNNYAYSLVLITDGGESCNGDICNVVKELLEKRVQFKPYIISLIDYAPLRSQYACLGNYLMASNPEQMNGTIGSIAENYRRVLNVPVLKPKPEEAPKPAPVVVKKENVPPPAPEKVADKITVLADQRTIPVSSQLIVLNRLKQRTIAQIPLPAKETEPAPLPVTPPPPKKEAIASLKNTRKLKLLPENNIRPSGLRRRTIAAVPLPAKEEEPVVLKKEELAKIKGSAPLRSFGLFWSTPSLKPRRIPLIDIPPKESTPVIAAASTPKPVTAKPAQPKPATQVPKPNKVIITDASYSVKAEPATETTLEVYFTNGKGKFYQTSPSVAIIDPKTGKEIKRFYRTVNAEGNPDGQPIPPGNYTVLVGRKGNFRAKSVTVLPNNKNKVYIVAINGTLSFKYTNNYKRPMEEFTALVKKNFEPGPVITQPCEQERQYEAGNYHIELNTLPISRRNLDIDFGTDFIVEIDEPGYVSITNTSGMGKAGLYYQQGDMFSKFYTLDITGNPALQKVQLQPGVYEIRYKDNGVFQSTMEKSVKFFIKSNTETEVLLQ